METKYKRRGGFTIVELLVVIVVIGILATITIVSYTGISQRAVVASIQSDLGNASKQFKIFQVENSGYPATLNCSLPNSTTNKCIKLSNNNTIFAYVVDNNINPQGFCLNITNGANSYKITSNATPAPTVGDCTVPTPVVTTFTTVGSFTYTVPNNISSVKVEAWGGYGGGGGPSGGDNEFPGTSGGLGGYGVGTVASISSGTVLSITIGNYGASSGWDMICSGNGAPGQESNVKNGATFYVRGYGGGAGTGSCSGGVDGSNGSGYANSGVLTSTSTITGADSANSGKGKVVITTIPSVVF